MIAHAVDVVHGDVETDDDAAAVRSLADRAWQLGCLRVHGTNDRTRYVMPTAAAQLALLSLADGLARSWWRVTTVPVVIR